MDKINRSIILYTGLFVSVIASLANILFFFVTKSLGEQYLIPLTESSIEVTPMPYFIIPIVTLTPAIFATLLFAFLNKLSPRNTVSPFLSISITGLIISFGGPLDLPGVGLQTKLLLCAMHVIAGIIIIGGLLVLPGKIKKTRSKIS